jgi:alpha-1,2-mannosyltransferase
MLDLIRRSPSEVQHPALQPIAVLVIGALAFACRLYPVVHGGGLKGVDGYDDGVYYSAADAVTMGRVPYRDFVLLHPPGLIYLLTPFAALGHLIGDANGWACARVAMMLVGATSSVLVFYILRRFGPVAAFGGAVLYAVWPPAIYGESSTFLECIPSLLLLAALLLLGLRIASHSLLVQLVAGAALGLGMSIKIWGLVPLLAVVTWQLVAVGRRRALAVLAGGLMATIIVCAPTFLLAPTRMWELVVADQLGRAGSHTSLLLRAASFTPVDRLIPHSSPPLRLAAVAAVALLVVAAMVLTVAVASARVFVALLVVQCAVLCVGPPYYTHYGAFLGPPVALTMGVGAERLTAIARHWTPSWRVPLIAGMALVLLVVALPVLFRPLYERFDGARVAAVLANRRCVVADSPGALVLANVLTRDLDRRCPTQIDVTGVTYNVAAVIGRDGRYVPRPKNSLWQRDLMNYLRSGQAAIVTRVAADGLDANSRRTLRRYGLLYRGPGVTVYSP